VFTFGSEFSVQGSGFVPAGAVRDVQSDSDNGGNDHHEQREEFEEKEPGTEPEHEQRSENQEG
jgi:hypothetical protein